MRNTIAKIENSYSGGDFVIVAGDATVLSVFAAAACKCELTEHAQFTLRPGEFFDVRWTLTLTLTLTLFLTLTLTLP